MRRSSTIPSILATPVRIFALDPSTDITGAVYVEYAGNSPRLLAYAAIDATPAAKGSDLAARLARIRWTREHLYSFLAGCSPIDVLAYETDTGRGHAVSEALIMAAGVYLSIPLFDGIPIDAITRQAACIAADCLSVYRAPKGKTSAEQAAKKARLKAAIVTWAQMAFPADDAAPFLLVGDPRSEAIADALAIAAAAYNRYIANQVATQAAIRPLFGPGSRGGKAGIK
jgi:Holliday junction resolvasome RuvABC endonuclease subunit